MSSSAMDATDAIKPVRACIFDVDGLLINSEDIYTEAYNNILQRYGRPDLPWTVKARQQSRGREGTLRLLNWAQLPITLEEWQGQVSAQRELFRKSELLPGVATLLNALSQRSSLSVHLAVASSASKSLFEVKTSHLHTITDAIPERHRVFGDDPQMSSRAGKPAPDIFLLALQRINDGLDVSEGRIQPEECLVFEDSIAGVEAGRKAAMRVIWVPHPRLLEVCKGIEEKVLDGTTEEDIDEQRLRPVADEVGGGGVPWGRGLEVSELREWPPDGELWMSKDGKAGLLRSLEEFSYAHYGIRLA